MSVLHASRLRPFPLLWAASTISALGDGVHWIALPLLAASVTTDPRLVSLVAVADHLPWLVFGLISGALADRVDRRRAMWITDVIRAVLVGAFTLLVLTGAVGSGTSSIVVILVTAFALTSFGTLRDSASAAYIPSIVPPPGRPRANGRLGAGMLVSDTLLGAPLGAVLFTAFAAAPFLLDTATFAIAALLIAAIPATAGAYSAASPPVLTGPGTGPVPGSGPIPLGAPRVDVPAARSSSAAARFRADIGVGIRFLLGDRLLRWLSVYSALTELVTTVAVALLVLYTTQVLHLGSLGYGLLVAAFAVGGVGGSLIGGRLNRILGARNALLLAMATAAVSFTALASSMTALPAGIAVAGFGAAVGLWNVISVSVRQALVPEGMLGRVTSAVRLITLGAGPIGALGAGFIAHRYGLRAPLVCGAALLVLAAVAAPVLLSRKTFPLADVR